MFWNLFVNENHKNFKRSMLWIEVAIIAALVLFIHLLLFATVELNLGAEASSPEAQSQLRSSLTWPGALPSALGFAGGNALGGMLLIILVGAVTAQEYAWRTLHLWLSRGVPRPILLTAKFAALAVPAFLLVLATLLSSGAITAIFTWQFEGALPFDQINFFQLGLSVLRTSYTLLPYAALTFLLAVAARSAVVAIGGGLAFSLLAEGVTLQLLTMMGGSLGILPQLLPAGLANSVNALNMAAIYQPVEVGPGLAPLPAAIGIAVWTLALLGLALAIFQRQDIAD